MKIDGYSFGEIVVDGKTYHGDLILFPEKIQQNWTRNEGHSLVLEDIKEIVDYHPKILIVGTGESGVLKIPSQTKEKLEKLNIRLIAQHTANACNTFNEYINKKEKVVGAFHLTC